MVWNLDICMVVMSSSVLDLGGAKKGRLHLRFMWMTTNDSMARSNTNLIAYFYLFFHCTYIVITKIDPFLFQKTGFNRCGCSLCRAHALMVALTVPALILPPRPCFLMVQSVPVRFSAEDVLALLSRLKLYPSFDNHF